MDKKKLFLAILILLAGGFITLVIDVLILSAKNRTLDIVSMGIYTSADTFSYDVSVFMVTAGYILLAVILVYMMFFKKEAKKEAVFEQSEFFPKNE